MSEEKRDSAYWKKRFEELERAQHEQGRVCYEDIEKMYRRAQNELEKEISKWYGRFARNNMVSMTDARKMLTGRELEELRWDVSEYIAHGEENAVSGAWLKQLENASARYHVSRLEALKLQTQQQLEVLFGNQLDRIDTAMKDIYTSGYYKTAFELQKGVGVGWNFATLDDKAISKVISKPWAVDGRNFSERIWKSKEKLINEMHKTLTQNIILGQDPQKAINTIAERMKVSKVNAGRLVMTEEAFFSSAAQKECFAELDVEEFEVVATLDSHTSQLCRDMDGKHFPISQYEIGVTAPPFHVNCRSTTCPYFNDEFSNLGERAARGADGKTYFVPANMTYREWEKSFVNNDKSSLQEIKPNTRSMDVNALSGDLKNETVATIDNANEIATNAITQQYNHRINDVGVNYVPYSEFNDDMKKGLGADFTGMDIEFAEATAKQFDMLSSEYESMCQKISVTQFNKEMASAPASTTLQMHTQQATIEFNEKIVGNREKFMQRMEKAVVERHQFPMMEESEYEKYVVTHEFAHTMMDFDSPLKNYVNAETRCIKSARKEIKAIRNEYIEKIRELTIAQKQAELEAITSFDESVWIKAQKLSEELESIKISEYADTSIDEFFAEAFTDAKIGMKPSEYSKRVLEVVDKYLKKESQTTNKSYNKNIDNMGRALNFVNDNFNVKAYKADKYKNIYSQTFSKDAQSAISFVENAKKDIELLNDVSEIVICKNIPGIAAYDNLNNRLYVNELLVNKEYVEKQLNDYFVADTPLDVLKHEMHHKQHWDFVKSKVVTNNSYYATISTAKKTIEEELRRYVSNQLSQEYNYLLTNVSENAYYSYREKGTLNEVVAEVLLQEDKDAVRDSELLKMVRRCIE